MKDLCPECLYDLAGLNRSVAKLCPECGTDIESARAAKDFSRRTGRRWKWFLLAPAIALPGVVLYGIGQPAIALILGTIFGYRALKRDCELYGEMVVPAGLFFHAVGLSVAWTTMTSLVLAMLFTLLVFVGGSG